MRILFLATRLAGTDGVSLEAHKMREVLERRGHEVLYCAGELDPGAGGHLVPEMHFTDAVAEELGARAFAGGEPAPELDAAIAHRAAEILARLEDVVRVVRPALLVVQNAWAIPMQLPLAVALARLVDDTGLPTLAHNHDYWWERDRFARCRVQPLLERFFPHHGSHVAHLSINSAAAEQLERRRGIASRVLPNVLDFEAGPPTAAGSAADFREAIGVAPTRPLLLQPTRVVPRKGIELAIELAARLADLHPALVITHDAGDEGHEYLRRLRALADERGVDLLHVADRVSEHRGDTEGGAAFSLWDAYRAADLVTYPSLYEGFGNALLEAVWLRRPLLVNRYEVYARDLANRGFDFVELDGTVDDRAEARARALLPPRRDAARIRELTEHNYGVAREHFDYRALARVLAEALAQLGLSL